jgi:hypothetical protein
VADDVAEKPPMPDRLRPLAQAAIARHQKRPAAPDVVSQPDHGVYDHLTCPYRDDDQELWVALILECFGTRVADVGQAFMRQLYALCPEVLYNGESQRRPDEETLRQALEIVYSLRPRTAAEAALAAQMVALHLTAMKVGHSIGQRSYTDSRTIASLALVAKTYGSLLNILNDRKGKRSTRQTIKVVNDKHVHFHDERHVHLRGRGDGKSGGQSHDTHRPRARATPALPGENASGRDLQIVPGEGSEALPSTRRS